MTEDARKSMAAAISADPAFTALEASGAPIFALGAEPLAIFYANAAAVAVFGTHADAGVLLGAEGAAERLPQLLEQLHKSGAPRLERLPMVFADGAQTVTVLCRRLSNDGGSFFVVAALGLRPTSTPAPARAAPVKPTPIWPAPTVPVAAPSTQPRTPELSKLEPAPALPPPATPTSPAPPALAEKTATDDGATERLRARLCAEHGCAARFLWKTDANDVFLETTPPLREIVGAANALIVGRGAQEVSRDFDLGDALTTALFARKSFSGVRVEWPLGAAGPGVEGRVPTDFGALPIHDAARRFVGFQGYGVLRLDQAVAALRAKAEPRIEEEFSRRGPRRKRPRQKSTRCRSRRARLLRRRRPPPNRSPSRPSSRIPTPPGLRLTISSRCVQAMGARSVVKNPRPKSPRPISRRSRNTPSTRSAARSQRAMWARTARRRPVRRAN